MPFEGAAVSRAGESEDVCRFAKLSWECAALGLCFHKFRKARSENFQDSAFRCSSKPRGDSSDKLGPDGYVFEEGIDLRVPPEIAWSCRNAKLLEELELAKNQNRRLRKLSARKCDCRKVNWEAAKVSGEDLTIAIVDGSDRLTEERMADLVGTVKMLQRKCRTKDGMIAALTDEIGRIDDPWRADRILRNLLDPEFLGRVRDFDRTTLWKYLTESSAEDSFRAATKRRHPEKSLMENIVLPLLPYLLFLLLLSVIFLLLRAYRFHDRFHARRRR